MTKLPRQPLVTFALFAYNQEKYIREAVEGAFSQTYEPMEIILSDDCSSDRTFEIMQEMAAAYDGPHELRVRRSVVNRGIASHFTDIIKLAKGTFIVLAAGDDVSLSRRTMASTAPLIENEILNLTEVVAHNFEGNALVAQQLDGTDNRICSDNMLKFSILDYIGDRAPELVGAARTIRKSAFLEYQDLERSCPTEDTPSLIRLLMLGGGAKITEMLLLRRIHRENLSSVGFKHPSRFISIERQYRKDVKLMLRKGRINKGMGKMLLVWAGVRTIRKSQGVMFSNSDTRLMKISKLLTSRDLHLRHKLIAIMDLFTRKLAGGEQK